MTVRAVRATPAAVEGEGEGEARTTVQVVTSKGCEDATSKGTRAEMSLGFALAPFPQASAVGYWLEYAAALDWTA